MNLHDALSEPPAASASGAGWLRGPPSAWFDTLRAMRRQRFLKGSRRNGSRISRGVTGQFRA